GQKKRGLLLELVTCRRSGRVADGPTNTHAAGRGPPTFSQYRFGWLAPRDAPSDVFQRHLLGEGDTLQTRSRKRRQNTEGRAGPASAPRPKDKRLPHAPRRLCA